MRKIKIRKGFHYPFPFIWLAFPFWVKKNSPTFRKANFMFTDSCMFDLHDEDQWDVNKLFGFSIGYHHKTSFRFGWRPKLKENKIQVVAYEYHDGVRQRTKPIIGLLELNKWYDFTIIYDPKQKISYYFVKKGVTTNEVNIKKNWGLGYTLGAYFGGNEKAPQDIIIYRKK